MKIVSGFIKNFLIGANLLLTPFLFGQETNDMEGWSSIELGVKANKNLSFSVSEHLRYRNDITTLKNYFTQAKVQYELFKNFEIGAGVRYITNNDDTGNIQGFEPLFRYQFDAVFSDKIDKVTVLFRLRYQNKNELGFSESEGDIPVEYTRYRMGFDYRIKALKLNAKLFGEVFNEAKTTDSNGGFNRHRYTLRISRKFKNFGTVTMFYANQNDYSTNTKKNKSIIGFKYSYRLNLSK